jgi:hypothetical protein
MAAKTIHVETVLPTDPERVWSALKHPASFLYVTRGLFGMPALAGRTDPVQAGEAGTGWLLAFHVVPLHRHTIEIVEVDEATRTIRTHERGGVLRRWDHSLHAAPVTPAGPGGPDVPNGPGGGGGPGGPGGPGGTWDGGGGGARCRYRDTVTIDAGPLTAVVAALAVRIYRYRHRRWHRLVRKHLLVAGPRHGSWGR